MDQIYEYRGSTFVWEVEKATQNERKHGINFEEASTVFYDPLFVVTDASRNEEERFAVTGFSAAGRLLIVAHLEVDGEFVRIISARCASTVEEAAYAQ